MLLMALKMGRTSQGSETFLHSGMQDREEEISQRGEAGVICVILVRNENGSLSPLALLTGDDEKWDIQIELTLFGSGFSFSCHLGMMQIFGNEIKLCYIYDRYMVYASSSIQLSTEHKVSATLSAGEMSALRNVGVAIEASSNTNL